MEKINTIIVFGSAGSGKSTLLNFLVKDKNPNQFNVSDDVNVDGTETTNIVQYDNNIYVDTPGLDSINVESLYHIYKDIPKNNNLVILLCISVRSMRYTTWKNAFIKVLNELLKSNKTINLNIIWSFYDREDKSILQNNLKFFDTNKYNLKSHYFTGQLKDKLSFNDFLINEIIEYKNVFNPKNNVKLSNNNNTQLSKIETDFIHIKIHYGIKHNNTKLSKLKYKTTYNEDINFLHLKQIGDKFLDLCLYYKLFYNREILKDSTLDYVRQRILSGNELARVHDNITKNSDTKLGEHTKADIVEFNIGKFLIDKDYNSLYDLMNYCIDDKL